MLVVSLIATSVAINQVGLVNGPNGLSLVPKPLASLLNLSIDRLPVVLRGAHGGHLPGRVPLRPPHHGVADGAHLARPARQRVRRGGPGQRCRPAATDGVRGRRRDRGRERRDSRRIHFGLVAGKLAVPRDLRLLRGRHRRWLGQQLRRHARGAAGADRLPRGHPIHPAVRLPRSRGCAPVGRRRPPDAGLSLVLAARDRARAPAPVSQAGMVRTKGWRFRARGG